MNEKVKEVAFADENLKKAYIKLRQGKFKEKQLFSFINRAINDLKNNPLCGLRLPNKLIPKQYIEKFGINNLWKYNLPNAWRLLYAIKGNEVMIISVIIE